MSGTVGIGEQVAGVWAHLIIKASISNLDDVCMVGFADERLHSDGDVLGVLGLRQRGLHDLVDEGAAVLVVLLQHVSPQVAVSALDEVASLCLEQARLEGALEETGLLTQLGDVRAIIVREHLVTQDGISDLHKPKHT